MQNLNQIKRRAETLSSLGDIVGAMKTMSQAYASGFERSAKAVDSYLKNVELGIRACLESIEIPHAAEPPFSPSPERPRAVVIAIGSDAGLVGRFNKSLAAHAAAWLGERSIPVESADGIICGRALRAKWPALRGAFFNMPRTLGRVAQVAGSIIEKMASGGVFSNGGKAFVFFNRREGGAFQSEGRQILPIDARLFRRIGRIPWPTRNRPMTAGDPREALPLLVRQFVFVSIYKALSASLAAEHRTRAIQMSRADDNIKEHLDELAREYQTRRQEEITAELLDITSGFNAAG